MDRDGLGGAGAPTGSRRARIIRRMMVVQGLLLLLFVAIAVRANYIQVVASDDMLSKGNWSHISTASHEGARGSILDRDGRELAHTVDAALFVVDPRCLLEREPEKAAALLAIVGDDPRLTPERMAQWRAAEPQDRPRHYRIRTQLWPDEADEIRGLLERAGIRCASIEGGFRRTYPFRDLAGAIVGFTTADAREGSSGIEASFNRYLAGGILSYRVHRDRGRRPYLLDPIPDLRDTRGADVWLTLDAPLQRFVEDALSDTIQEYAAVSGVAIVSRPSTGEILAMASWPPFDPNHVRSESASHQDLVYIHPAVGHVYEPGSTTKIVTFAAAFDSGAIGYETQFNCHGGRFQLGQHTFTDSQRAGVIPAWQVLQYSSNIGTLQIGFEIGQRRQRATFEAFGFGSRTGIGLAGEEPGSLPGLPWRVSEHATISYGYGFNATPLQINMATAAIANEGRLMQPILVSHVVAADGEVILRNTPTVRGQAVSPEAAALVTRAMETVGVPRGTGTRAVVPGVRTAGKTGTTRLIDPATGAYGEIYMSSYTGFVPADEPRFAITVMVRDPDPEIGYFAGVVAAPLFRRIAIQALARDGIFVDDDSAEEVLGSSTPSPSGAMGTVREPAGPQTDAETPRSAFGVLGGQGVPDFTGAWVSEALEKASAYGLRLHVHGTGRIVRQSPASGTHVPRGGVIEVWLEDSERLVP